MAQFQKGNPGGPGRVKGSRNRIAYKLIEALEKDFQDHGEQAIKIARIERPVPADWWSGKRFDKPIRAWAAGVTSESVRDVLQDKLVGPPFRQSDWGRGLIPKECLGEVSMARGTADLIDTISVKHVTGDYSTLQFKSYAAGREKWQGVGLEVVYLDEEPPADIYFEALTRTNETGGIVYMCFTPLLGMSSIVRMFLHEGTRV